MAMETPIKSSEAYICQNCAFRVLTPYHSGEPMILKSAEEKFKFVCVKGASCGTKLLDSCCEYPYLVADE